MSIEASPIHEFDLFCEAVEHTTRTSLDNKRSHGWYTTTAMRQRSFWRATFTLRPGNENVHRTVITGDDTCPYEAGKHYTFTVTLA